MRSSFRPFEFLIRRAGPAVLLATVWSLVPSAAAAQGTGLIQTGDQAPDFTLRSIDGEEHTLSGAVESGPVVLVLYRGVW